MPMTSCYTSAKSRRKGNVMSGGKLTTAVRAFAYLSIVLLCTPAFADEPGGPWHWVTPWGTSHQPNLPAATVSNATPRHFARVTIPAQLIRIRLHTPLGPPPLPL